MRKNIFLAGVVLAALSGCDDEAGRIINEMEKERREREAAEQWQYTTLEDEMRGTETKVASVKAEGITEFAPTMHIHKRPDGSETISVSGSYDSVAAPQMRCYGHVSVKFDDADLVKVPCQMGVAVVLDPAIIDQIKNSEIVWIEIPTNSLTLEQFKFNTAGFEQP